MSTLHMKSSQASEPSSDRHGPAAGEWQRQVSGLDLLSFDFLTAALCLWGPRCPFLRRRGWHWPRGSETPLVVHWNLPPGQGWAIWSTSGRHRGMGSSKRIKHSCYVLEQRTWRAEKVTV